MRLTRGKRWVSIQLNRLAGCPPVLPLRSRAAHRAHTKRLRSGQGSRAADGLECRSMVGRGPAALIACVAVLGAAATARAAEYDLVPIEAKAADGIVLRGHAYLPKQAQQPLGTVLS